MGHSNEILKSGGKLDPHDSVVCYPPTGAMLARTVSKMMSEVNDPTLAFNLHKMNCCDRSEMVWTLNEWVKDLCEASGVSFEPSGKGFCGAWFLSESEAVKFLIADEDTRKKIRRN